MNGYDFDDTIFRGNSTRRFFFFCLLRLPYLVIMIPVIVVAGLLRGLRILNKDQFLYALEWYVALLPNAEKLAVKFWDKNMNRIKPWYLKQKRKSDVIVSASPKFLIEEACKRLEVRCIATNLDTRGRLHGKHCYGGEKVVAYKSRYKENSLLTYYSDSLSDTPMMKMAEYGYLVNGDEVTLIYEHGTKY